MALSHWIGVGGLVCPSSCNVSLDIFASFVLKKNAPNSDSAADAATNLSIMQRVKIMQLRRMG